MSRSSVVGKLMLVLGADSVEMEQVFKSSKRTVEDLGKSMTKIGQTLSVSLTAPLAALGAMSLKYADTQLKAEAKVEQAIKSTAGAAQLSFEQLKSFASELQGKTIFGDEKILADATAQLLTFTNIAGENFKRTQKVALDLSTLLDGDLKSASIQLGKALNDPVANLSALSRSGIQFTVEQKEVIKYLAETNRLAEAQTIILDELERQYGGQAEAAAKAGLGGVQQLQNSWGDFMELIGIAIQPMLDNVVASLSNLVAWLNNLDPKVIKTGVVVGGLVAAIGPLSLAIGGLISALPLLAAGFAAITGPVGLAVAALVGLAAAFAYTSYQQEKFKKAAEENLKNSSVEDLQKQLEENEKQLAIMIDQSMRKDNSFFNRKAFIEGLKLTNKELKEEIALRKKQAEEQENASKAAKKASEDALSAWKKLMDAEKKAAEEAKILAKSDGLGVTAFSGNIFRSSLSDLEPVGDSSAATAWLDNLREELWEKGELLRQQIAALSEMLRASTQNLVVGLAEDLGQIAVGDLGFDAILKTIGDVIAGFIISLGQYLIQAGIAYESFKKAAEAIAEAIGGAGAIVAGVALIAVGTALRAKLQEQGKDAAPKLAKGGLAYGATYAMVGDNPNAHVDPEVIAPLSKLQNIIGAGNTAQNVRIELAGQFKLRSQELIASIDKGNYRYKTIKGNGA